VARTVLAKRLDGLVDEPRPGTPRRISDAEVEHVIATTLETTPRDATHWSNRTLAKQVALSHSTVGRIWRAFGLQPHRSETFKLSTDPLFIDKVRDIVGLYLAPRCDGARNVSDTCCFTAPKSHERRSPHLQRSCRGSSTTTRSRIVRSRAESRPSARS
jgi:hypothetical protein